jgi:hypothetical protein
MNAKTIGICQLALPFYGGDLNRVLWEADAEQVLTLALHQLGIKGPREQQAQRQRDAMIAARIKGLKRG